MKLISAILLALFLAYPVTAAPLVKVDGGYVDWCRGLDEKAEAMCVHGEFAFDWEGNIITEVDGPGPDEGEESDA